jgi:acetyl esterase/lipase
MPTRSHSWRQQVHGAKVDLDLGQVVDECHAMRVEDLHFTARDGHPLPARLYAPEQPALDRPALPVLLYLHGGGFTMGSIATHDSCAAT